jgi:hypothetical protein
MPTNGAFKAEKINTGLMPAMSSFAYRPLNRAEDCGRLLVLFYHSLPLLATPCIARSLPVSWKVSALGPLGFE